MSSAVTDLPAKKKHTPYVPETMEMKEFTFRALLIGLVMTAILGSANAYLGLKAGMTIAATYPAAVIGMALLRLMKGSLLEENIARTVGSIGESVAAGAIFTIPAFVMADLWPALTRAHSRILEVSRANDDRRHAGHSVRDAAAARDGRGSRLPYPESVAASEIHKAGQQGSTRRQDSVRQHGIRRLHVSAGRDQRVQSQQHIPGDDWQPGQKIAAAHQHEPERRHDDHRRHNLIHRPRRQPGISRRGLHHWTSTGRVEFRRRRARLGTAGSTPNLYDRSLHPGARSRRISSFRGHCSRAPSTSRSCVPSRSAECWSALLTRLFKMRKQLALGMGRAVSDLKKSAAAQAATNRTERDLPAKASLLASASFSSP